MTIKEAENVATSLAKNETPTFMGGKEIKDLIGPVKEPYKTAIETGEFVIPGFILGGIAKTNWFGTLNSDSKALVVLSLNDMMEKGLSEGEILRRWNNPMWRKEALEKEERRGIPD